jgi:hypothetical protein
MAALPPHGERGGLHGGLCQSTSPGRAAPVVPNEIFPGRRMRRKKEITRALLKSRRRRAAHGTTARQGDLLMADPDKALATQLANIEKRTGKSLAELEAIVKNSGLARHGELVAMLKSTLGMGHGDANTLVHTALKSDGRSAAASQGLSADRVLDGLYTGPKAALRPIHDRLMAELRKFGEFEEAPKKTYVSYRRKKQFAMIGPATNTRVEVGLNVKGLQPTDRLQALPAGQMCNYKIKLTDAGEVDAELSAWIRKAYEAAG